MSLLSELIKKHQINLPLTLPKQEETPSTGIIYNTEQQKAIDLALTGKSFVLIGAAGTGKTTCMKGVVSSLITSNNTCPLKSTSGHKYLCQGMQGIILTSFTRRAVRNLRKQMSADLRQNCITLHKLLEYQPHQYEVIDPVTNTCKTSMRFEPSRNAANPLPAGITTIIVDESSMVSTELFNELLEALPYPVQFIFLGDIQQLPPVFGSAVLGYKMLEYPVIELTQVYRQALESPIIRLAHRILSGKTITKEELPEWKVPNLTLHPWKKKIHKDVALLTAAKFFTTSYDNGIYDPEEDVILCPFNKAFGTVELNKHVANHLAHKHNRTVYEVIAGFNKHYFSVGDKVLYEREDAEIVSITKNAGHTGKMPQDESPYLDYWGFNSAGSTHTASTLDLDAVDVLMAAMASDNSDRVTTSSHVITIKLLDSDEEVALNTAAEINALLMGYALTVHKAQGSEWRRVFIVLHQSHNIMIQRELLYTAVTRAREELYVICEPEHFISGVNNQRIPGNTLASKIEYFKGKHEEEN